MKIKLLVLLMMLFPQSMQAKECVILLHGLARTASSMKTMSTVLEEQGYRVANIGYPSRSNIIEKLSIPAIETGLTLCGKYPLVHFVTHSMGGILVRHYLSTKNIKRLGRVVMLGPPNKGSQIVDKLGNVPGFKLINGPAGMQLGTDKKSLPNSLGAANFDLGVIAGTRSINLILSLSLPNPDDGKVSVENTQLEGMNDHISLPVSHPFMMNNSKVIDQVIHFLKHGAFDHSIEY